MPKLQYDQLVSVRQYIKSDPPTQTFHNHKQQLMGYPSVVWQQQMEKATQKKTYPNCGTCGKTNYPEERYWQATGAHLKPKRTRPEDSVDNDPDSKASKPHQK